MILDIDIDLCINEGITAHQYVVLKLISDDNYDLADDYLRVTNTWESFSKELEELMKKNLIESRPFSGLYNITDITPSQKFIKLHSFSEDPFEEFYNTYPTKVVRSDGIIDYLRVDHKRSRLLYINIIRMNKLKHDHLIKCLRAEIKERKATGQMAFMKRMSKWLVSEEWKLYENKIRDLKETQEVITNSYGEDVE